MSGRIGFRFIKSSGECVLANLVSDSFQKDPLENFQITISY